MTSDGDDSEKDIAGMYDREGEFTDAGEDETDSDASGDASDTGGGVESPDDSEETPATQETETPTGEQPDASTQETGAMAEDGVVLGEDTGDKPDTEETPSAETSDDENQTPSNGGKSAAGMYAEDERVGPGDAPAPDTDAPVGSDSVPGESGDSDGLSIEPGTDEPETVEGTFYVKYGQEDSVTLHDVETAQICTLVENPGLDRHDIVEGTLVAQPPMGVSYLFDEMDAHYSVPVETSPEPPTKQVREIATAELESGQALPIEREGNGEIHILRVDPELVEEAIEDLIDDETTYKNAARFEHVERVEIRSDSDDGIVSVRYLP